MIEPPEPPPGWLDGPIGALRAALILTGALLLGLALGAAERATMRADTEARR